jgi:hypothetical protein
MGLRFRRTIAKRTFLQSANGWHPMPSRLPCSGVATPFHFTPLSVPEPLSKSMPKMTTNSLSGIFSRAALVGVTLLAATFTAQAFTYYVDANAGSDRNAGTSPNAPWQNCPGMTAYAGPGLLRPGDIVYFNRGATWKVSGLQGLYLTGGVTYVGNAWGKWHRQGPSHSKFRPGVRRGAISG